MRERGVRFALLAVLLSGLTGCATRGELVHERFETDQKIGSARLSALGHDQDIINQMERIEKRIEAVERDIRGPWDREECERYKPEAQQAFCHRLPRFMGVGR
jgi:hypothetical protein